MFAAAYLRFLWKHRKCPDSQPSRQSNGIGFCSSIFINTRKTHADGCLFWLNNAATLIKKIRRPSRLISRAKLLWPSWSVPVFFFLAILTKRDFLFISILHIVLPCVAWPWPIHWPSASVFPNYYWMSKRHCYKGFFPHIINTNGDGMWLEVYVDWAQTISRYVIGFGWAQGA